MPIDRPKKSNLLFVVQICSGGRVFGPFSSADDAQDWIDDQGLTNVNILLLESP